MKSWSSFVFSFSVAWNAYLFSAINIFPMEIEYWTTWRVYFFAVKYMDNPRGRAPTHVRLDLDVMSFWATTTRTASRKTPYKLCGHLKKEMSRSCHAC